jgi:hypothetical protein
MNRRWCSAPQKWAIAHGFLALAGMCIFAPLGRAQSVQWNFESIATATGAPPELPDGITVLQGNATVTSEEAFSGNYSLKIEATEPSGQVAFNLPNGGNPVTTGVLYVDFELLTMAANATNAAASADAAGAQTGFVQVNSQGELYAYDAHGSGAWLATGVFVGASGNGALSQWVRLTMQLNQVAGTWDLYVNGAMVESGLGLDPTSGQQVVLFGDTQVPVYVDDVSIGPANPLLIATAPPTTGPTSASGLSSPATTMSMATGTSGTQSLSSGNTSGNSTANSSPGQAGVEFTANQSWYTTPIVFVHPTIRSWADAGNLIQALNAASPNLSANLQSIWASLAGALQNASAIAAAGTNLSVWQFAADLPSAISAAPNGAHIVILPGLSPYVLQSLNPQGKQVVFHCLPGVVFSTPAAVSTASFILSQSHAQMMATLAANATSVSTQSTSVLNSLWPVAAVSDPSGSSSAGNPGSTTPGSMPAAGNSTAQTPGNDGGNISVSLASASNNLGLPGGNDAVQNSTLGNSTITP